MSIWGSCLFNQCVYIQAFFVILILLHRANSSPKNTKSSANLIPIYRTIWNLASAWISLACSGVVSSKTSNSSAAKSRRSAILTFSFEDFHSLIQKVKKWFFLWFHCSKRNRTKLLVFITKLPACISFSWASSHANRYQNDKIIRFSAYMWIIEMINVS